MNVTIGGQYPVLVGFDGSPPAGTALRWAQEEAARRHAPVELIYVYEWATPVAAVPAAVGWPAAIVRREATAVVDEAVTHARMGRPGQAVSGEVIDGTVISTLRRISEQAQLLVVAHRGLGGFAGLLAGSVAVGVATYAQCPVVVVRGCAAPGLPVVVGVDDGAHTDETIRFACEEAISRGVPLVAVRAWQPPPVPWRREHGSPPAGLDELASAERLLAEQLLAPWQEKYSQLEMRLRLLPATPAHALVVASTEAQLVVVGPRGRGGFRGLLLGSVARQLIHHSSCPVAIVHSPDSALAAQQLGGEHGGLGAPLQTELA
jgi:nucleotide-binding universal stress UspA family protein